MSEIMNDGYQTLIAFGSDPGVIFEEKEVTPPGIDGGGEIDTTTMQNTAYRTKYPKALITLSASSVVVAWDPATYPKVLALVNVNNLITITFPDGDTLAFWGWLDKFTPGANTEGEQPTADLEIIASNVNATGVETPPAWAVAV